MVRVVSAAALLLAVASLGAPAHADWRYDEEWRWRHRPPHYHPAPEVIMVYPAPPPVIYRPGPRVVYVEPPPVQPVQVTPTSPPYTDPQGRYCREYQSTVVVAGQAQPSFGTACLMPDGQWRIVQ